MEMNGSPALLQRIGRLLRAKQFLVFYAIGLAALWDIPLLLSGWLREHRPLIDLWREQNSLLGDLVASPGLATAGVTLAFAALFAWFTAGYLRSLVGRLRWGPSGGRQYRRMLGYTLIYVLVSWGLSATAVALGFNDPDTTPGAGAQIVAELLQLIVNLALLYVGYVIVISDVSVWRSLRVSLATVRRNMLISVLILLLPGVVMPFVWAPVAGLEGGAARVSPSIVLVVVVSGVLSFVSDVVLVCVYVDTLERRPGEVTDDGD
jgi:hypothetical protein